MNKKEKSLAESVESPFQSILPKGLRAGKDKLLVRLDVYGESIVMQTFDKKEGSFKLVSPHDLALTLSADMNFASGLLPDGALWWSSSKDGPVTAVWVEPGIRRLALQENYDKPPLRLDVPLPGLIFLCRPGKPPHVYAAAKRPTGPKTPVFKAPLANIYDDGRTCPGNHQYPADVAAIPENFLVSFFSHGANLGGRSRKHPSDVTLLWKELSRLKKKEYPLSDLRHHGTVADLMAMRL